VGLDFPPEIMYWDDWDPAWSPDGSEIAIRSNRATRYVPEWDPRSIIYDILHHDLFLLDTLGNAVQVTGDVVDGPYPRAYDSPSVESLSWSPDGRIAFASGQGLWVVDRDGFGLHKVLTHSHYISSVDWSPAGGTIAFLWTPACSESGCDPFRISLFDVATGSVRLLTDPNISSRFPSWSPDGSQLIYLTQPATGPPRINRINNDGTGAIMLFEIPGGGYDWAWSPCGDQIAFSRTTAPGAHQLLLVQADGSDVRQLTQGEQASWSPDCSKLAFIRECVDECDRWAIDVWIINAEGSRERKVTRRN
jgi:Tol biopolymer transport system component